MKFRLTGRRRPAPLPEPLELQPRSEPARPLEPEGVGLYAPPIDREPLPPCSSLGGCLPDPDDASRAGERRCFYCGEVVQ